MTLPSYTTPFIEVPPPQRRPLRGGLFEAIGPDAVHDLTRLAGHGLGVAYESVNCNRPIGVLPAPCSTEQPPMITSITCDLDNSTSSGASAGIEALQGVFEQDISCDCGMHLSYGAPFMLYASACVSPMETEQEIRARAMEALQLGAQRGVERIFATILPRLAEDITPQACQYGIAGTLAALEGQIAATYDGTGVIHAPAFAATYLAAASLIDPTESVPQTRLGTRFAFGGGYSGDGPNSEDATDCTFWMYVTPAVDVYRGDISVPFLQNTTHNTTMAVAQQPYAITIDCGGIYGARVNVDPCNC